jgi:hypothetical protein
VHPFDNLRTHHLQALRRLAGDRHTGTAGPARTRNSTRCPPLRIRACAYAAACCASAGFAFVASSTRYTRPRKLTPEWLLRLISQVRLVL